jgi:MFS family permease
MALRREDESTDLAPSVSQSGQGLHYAYVILAVGLICLVGALGFGRFAYALLLPSMREEFKTSYIQMGTIATSNALAYMISSLVCGLIASRFGARLVVSSAVFLCGLGMIWTASVTSVEQAALAQFVCGLGTGGVVGPVYSIVNPWFVPAKRGTATGITQMGSGIGLVLGGIVVPQLLALGGTSGWRFSWYVLAGVVLATALVAWGFLRNDPREKNLKPVGADRPVPASRKVVRHSPANYPQTVGEIYRNFSIWHLGLVFACFGLSYVVYTVFFAAHLGNNGLDSHEAGFIWSLGGLVSVAGSLLWGWFADRFGRKLALIMVLGIQGAALLELAFSHTRPGFYLGAMAYGLVLWGMPVVISIITAELVGPRLAAAALGLVIVLFGLGQVGGPILAGWLKDLSGSLELPLIVSAGIAWGGALLAVFLKTAPRQSNA